MHGQLCRPLEQQMANLECNAVCGVAITHHFLAKMVCAFLRTSEKNACTLPRSYLASLPARCHTLVPSGLM